MVMEASWLFICCLVEGPVGVFLDTTISAAGLFVSVALWSPRRWFCFNFNGKLNLEDLEVLVEIFVLVVRETSLARTRLDRPEGSLGLLQISKGTIRDFVAFMMHPSAIIFLTKHAVFVASSMPECSLPSNLMPTRLSAPFRPCG